MHPETGFTTYGFSEASNKCAVAVGRSQREIHRRKTNLCFVSTVVFALALQRPRFDVDARMKTDRLPSS